MLNHLQTLYIYINIYIIYLYIKSGAKGRLQCLRDERGGQDEQLFLCTKIYITEQQNIAPIINISGHLNNRSESYYHLLFQCYKMHF